VKGVGPGEVHAARRGERRAVSCRSSTAVSGSAFRVEGDRVQTSIYDNKHLGSMKNTTHLDQISHRKTASGTNCSKRWTYRVFIMFSQRD